MGLNEKSGLSRRQFVRRIVAGIGLVASGSLRLLSFVMPARFLRAIPGRRFPGVTRPLDESEMGRPASWAG